MSKIILGSALSLQAQREALSRYVHRFTRTHVPAWARKPMPNGSAYPVQFDSDADWLANTYFRVTARGQLVAYSDMRGDCQSYPTWPDNPELRGRRERLMGVTA